MVGWAESALTAAVTLMMALTSSDGAAVPVADPVLFTYESWAGMCWCTCYLAGGCMHAS